ncbi:hypothetical protein V2J09_011445 [Rumex salicifolius]
MLELRLLARLVVSGFFGMLICVLSPFVVYAPHTTTQRTVFWNDLNIVVTGISEPMFIGGDSNCILSLDERGFGNPKADRALNQLKGDLWVWNKEKSREKWIVDEDRNTTFFHTSTIIRRRRKHVDALKDSHVSLIFENNALEDMVVGYFKELYTTSQATGWSVVEELG